MYTVFEWFISMHKSALKTDIASRTQTASDLVKGGICQVPLQPGEDCDRHHFAFVQRFVGRRHGRDRHDCTSVSLSLLSLTVSS